MSEIVHIPFHGGEVLAVDVNGKPWVVLRPAFAAIGLEPDRQIAKVRAQRWSTTSVTAVVADDGRNRDMVIADLRTFLMALATIPASRVSESARPLLEAYQIEVADAIERHFTGAHEDYTKFTWTLDEACAIIRQRYYLDHNVISLCRLLRTAGIFKQNGTPTAKFAQCFHFTGTAWTILPVAMATIGKRLVKVTHQLQQSYAIQMRLELEGLGSSRIVGEDGPGTLRLDIGGSVIIPPAEAA